MTEHESPALVPLSEAMRVLGLPRTTAYKLARTGWLIPDALPVFYIGGYKVTRAQLSRVVNEGITRAEAS